MGHHAAWPLMIRVEYIGGEYVKSAREMMSERSVKGMDRMVARSLSRTDKARSFSTSHATLPSATECPAKNVRTSPGLAPSSRLDLAPIATLTGAVWRITELAHHPLQTSLLGQCSNANRAAVRRGFPWCEYRHAVVMRRRHTTLAAATQRRSGNPGKWEILRGGTPPDDAMAGSLPIAHQERATDAKHGGERVAAGDQAGFFMIITANSGSSFGGRIFKRKTTWPCRDDEVERSPQYGARLDRAISFYSVGPRDSGTTMLRSRRSPYGI